MAKPVQRGRYKNKQTVTCDQCISCIYMEQGDMYCEQHRKMAYVYDDFCPTDNYMWCNGKLFEER